MTMLVALVAVAALGTSFEDSRLAVAFEEGGKAGFLLAISELEREEGSERTAKTLVELASGAKGDVAAVAAHALGRLGDVGKAVLPELAEALVSGDFPTELLNELGVGDIPLWLAEALARAEYPMADNAAFALATQFDLKAEERLLPMLVQAASRGDPDEGNWQQYWAIHALGKMRGTAAPAQAMLLEILRTEPASDAQQVHGGKANIVRGVAAYALGQIGGQPDSAVPVLVQLLEHPDQTIRDWCALGLPLFEQQKNPERAARMLVRLRARLFFTLMIQRSATSDHLLLGHSICAGKPDSFLCWLRAQNTGTRMCSCGRLKR